MCKVKKLLRMQSCFLFSFFFPHAHHVLAFIVLSPWLKYCNDSKQSRVNFQKNLYFRGEKVSSRPKRQGSGSFHHKQISKEILISTFFYFLSLKTVNLKLPSKSKKQKTLEKTYFFCWLLVSHWRKKQDPGPDPDP